MTTSLIAAITWDYGIGNKNQLLYPIPEDLKRFKKLTSGHHVIMGRKTYESIGRPLPNRTNIIVSSVMKQEDYPDLVIKDNVLSAWEYAFNKGESELFVIGGGEIYNSFIHLAHKLYLTVILDNIEADTHFPYFDWTKYKETYKEYGEHNGVKYGFLDLTKKGV